MADFTCFKAVCRFTRLAAVVKFCTPVKTQNPEASASGFIPKNTDGSLTSRMIFSRWKRIQPMATNWY